MTIRAMLILLPCIALLSSVPAHAEVYKCTDNQGKVTYTGTPCEKVTTTEEILLDSSIGSERQERRQLQSSRKAGMTPNKDVTAGMVSTKKMSKVDSGGDVWFSIKVPIKNSSQRDRDVTVILKAVDLEDFEVKTVILNGNVRAGREEVLTDKTYMAEKEYRHIKEWKIVSLTER